VKKVRPWWLALAAGLALSAPAVLAVSAAQPAKSAEEIDAAFGRLKALAGEWESVAEGSSFPGTQKVSYRLIGGGSTVLETLFPGTKMEMVSAYHRDGKDLVMTHYCAAGNQPRFKARFDAKTSKLIFDFAGGTNLDAKKDLHIHEGVIQFLDDNTILSEWTVYKDGKPAGSHKFKLKRINKAQAAPAPAPTAIAQEVRAQFATNGSAPTASPVPECCPQPRRLVRP
jgi:hypothetical protein